ncbi:MAG TPA: DUF92 domain-containing protein [Gemmatimonadaceae bacterium]|nr:DUF92 domain-containing protein [Gemmatimonadaceae bacterium]
MERVAAGIALAAVIAAGARAARSLTTDGAIAATLVGAASVAAGWSWGALLLAFFLSSSALSRIGIDIKHRRTSGILEKGGARDATQVLANGGVFAAAAVGYVVLPSHGWMAIGAGALAAVTADTWATEIGTLAKGIPRLITTWRPAPPGTSGAVTVTGTIAMVLGSAFLTLGMAAAVWPRHILVAAFVGGVLGALADSLAGATMQARRRCASCEALTERAIHSCGAHTAHAGGASWMTNDAVNMLCSVIGATSALVASRVLQ